MFLLRTVIVIIISMLGNILFTIYYILCLYWSSLAKNIDWKRPLWGILNTNYKKFQVITIFPTSNDQLNTLTMNADSCSLRQCMTYWLCISLVKKYKTQAGLLEYSDNFWSSNNSFQFFNVNKISDIRWCQ